uniref:Transcriptional regulator, AcrR family n=1 Tax=Parastrongyloides trichosuri TaxID=131310 RepID=A0A0N5A115_PARTI
NRQSRPAGRHGGGAVGHPRRDRGGRRAGVRGAAPAAGRDAAGLFDAQPELRRPVPAHRGPGRTGAGLDGLAGRRHAAGVGHARLDLSGLRRQGADQTPLGRRGGEAPATASGRSDRHRLRRPGDGRLRLHPLAAARDACADALYAGHPGHRPRLPVQGAGMPRLRRQLRYHQASDAGRAVETHPVAGGR